MSSLDCKICSPKKSLDFGIETGQNPRSMPSVALQVRVTTCFSMELCCLSRGTLRGRQSPGKAPAKPRQSPSGSWNSMLTVTLSPFASLRKPRVMMNPSMASSEHTGTVPQTNTYIYIYIMSLSRLLFQNFSPALGHWARRLAPLDTKPLCSDCIELIGPLLSELPRLKN